MIRIFCASSIRYYLFILRFEAGTSYFDEVLNRLFGTRENSELESKSMIAK